jgi:omega-amidase
MTESTTLRVTLVQQPLVWQDPAANRKHFDSVLAPIAGNTDLVLLPETFTTGFSMETEKYAEAAGGPTSQWLLTKADELGAAVAGSVMTKEEALNRRAAQSYYNRLYWAEPGGTLRQYDKRHLFRMASEDQSFTAGKDALLVSWRGFRIVPLVCYDLRFPVFSRRRPELEYDLLVYVANWPTPRRNAWRALLKARAIENLAFVAGVNRVGSDGRDQQYAGHSIAHDFLGETLAELGEAPGVATAKLDLSALRAFRERFPAHLDADRFTLDA